VAHRGHGSTGTAVLAGRGAGANTSVASESMIASATSSGLGYLRSGSDEGAEAVVGGDRYGDRGYFVQPTVLANTNRDMKVEREEIFGPVVCAIPFDSSEEIVPAANNTNYGLAAGVFTRDLSKAHRTAARLRAGTVWVNTYHVFDAAMPFGGYKESGWGREMGHQVLNSTLGCCW